MRSSGCGMVRAGGMSVAERSAADAAQRIAVALDRVGLSYAVGGALALAIADVPRGTAYVDINVFVPAEQVPEVIAVLESLGIERLIAVRPELDAAYVRRWIVDMMGADDERTRRWDDIVTRFGWPAASGRDQSWPPIARALGSFRGWRSHPRRAPFTTRRCAQDF